MFFCAIAVVTGAAAMIVPQAFANNQAVQQMTPARDGESAVEEEFRAAETSDTDAAWKLFIARNPRQPLADEARRRLALPR